MKFKKIIIALSLLLVFVSADKAQIDDDIAKELMKDLDFSDILGLGPKKIKGLELGTQSPNELENFEFFRKGKLKDLKLGISTKEDVAKIFGKCTDLCKYDWKWNIVFDYFSAEDAFTSKYIDGKGNIVATQKFAPLPGYIGKLRSIRFAPLKKLSFKTVVFSNEFYKSLGVIFGDSFDGSSSNSLLQTYTDGYGLTYSVIESDECRGCKKKDISEKGELLSIEYKIPKHLEEKMFVEQK